MAFHSRTPRCLLKFVPKEIVSPYGYPEFILSDNDPKFISAPNGEYARDSSMKLKFVAIYNPQETPRLREWWEH